MDDKFIPHEITDAIIYPYRNLVQIAFSFCQKVCDFIHSCYLWREGLMMATTAVTSGFSSAQTTVTLSNTSTGFETTNDALANIGFIVSICIVHRCAIYRDKSITRLNIMQNYNITEIPAGAFFGATNVEVCQNINYRYSQLQQTRLMQKMCLIMIYFSIQQNVL